MRKYLIYIVLLISSTLYSASFDYKAVFIGPTLHFTLGHAKQVSYGFEISYWNSNFGGVDFGFELGNNKKRIYSEYQYGFIAGTSIGYVREFVKNDKSKGGFQLSCWMAYFGGIELRYRKFDSEKTWNLGGFAKLPIYYDYNLNIFDDSDFNFNFM
jgi:hypothetical protein